MTTVPLIADTAADFSSIAKELRAAGLQTIIRYYAKASARQGKSLTAKEAKLWQAAGVSLVVVYEDRGGDSGHIEDFDPDKMTEAGKRSLVMAAEVGQPVGSCIYLAVDGSYSKAADLARIRAGFEAFGAVVRPAGYRVGAYGCGTVVEMLRHEKLADLVWLAGAMSWSGSRALRDSGAYDLLQAPTASVVVAGTTFGHDPNTAKVADFGQWGAGHATPPAAIPAPHAGFGRVLRRGDKGEDVARLQRILGLKDDGDFGGETEAAVKGFQLGASLGVDGVAGKATGPALIAKEK